MARCTPFSDVAERVPRHHVAVEVDHHEVVERHLLVAERRRRHHHGAVVDPARHVAGRALDQPAGVHGLGRGEHRGAHLVERAAVGPGHGSTSGLTQCRGRSPASSRAMSSAIIAVWLTSVS